MDESIAPLAIVSSRVGDITAVSWWLFALAGVVALGIAVLTVSWQTWRVASRNPIEALRYE
jgi:putative ABC transport system permease protein